MSGRSQARNFFVEDDVEEIFSPTVYQNSGTGTSPSQGGRGAYFLKSRNHLVHWNLPDEIEARVQLETHNLTQEGSHGLSVFMLRDVKSGMPVNRTLTQGELAHINDEVSRRMADNRGCSVAPKTRDELDFELATGQSYDWRPTDPNTTYGGDQIPWPMVDTRSGSHLTTDAHNSLGGDGSGTAHAFDPPPFAARMRSQFQGPGGSSSAPGASHFGRGHSFNQTFHTQFNINMNGTTYHNFGDMPPAAQETARRSANLGLNALNSLNSLFGGPSGSSGRRSNQNERRRRY